MDQRHTTPGRMFAEGTIMSEDGCRAYPCTTDNISETGALLNVKTEALLPLTFKLTVPSEKLNRVCKMLWRVDERVGVQFL